MESEVHHSGIYHQGMIFLHRGDFEGARRCFEQDLMGAR